MDGINITLTWSWLKYDIDQETMKAAKCLITEDPTGERTMEAQTADDVFDIDYCRRKITEACSKLSDVLHKFFGGVKMYARKSMEYLDPSKAESYYLGKKITTPVGDMLYASHENEERGVRIDFKNGGSLFIIAYEDEEPQYTYVENGEEFVWDASDIKIENRNADATQLEELQAENIDRINTNVEQWVVTLNNFGTRRNVDSNLLTNELHQYVVLYVLQEWCKMTHPTMEENYLRRLTAEENRMKNICYRKEAPTRPE